MVHIAPPLNLIKTTYLEVCQDKLVGFLKTFFGFKRLPPQIYSERDSKIGFRLLEQLLSSSPPAPQVDGSLDLLVRSAALPNFRFLNHVRYIWICDYGF